MTKSPTSSAGFLFSAAIVVAALVVMAGKKIMKLTPADYVKKMKPLIERICVRENGLNGLAVMNQAAHESGNGNSELAAKYHNHFGIKWPSKPENQKAALERGISPVTLLTLEGASQVKQPEKFKAYRTDEDCLHDYCRIVRANFPAAAAAKTSAQDYAAALERGRWATAQDPVTKQPVYAKRLAAQLKTTAPLWENV